MANDSINDFLLDQELEPDATGEDNDLPDDIDAILDAVEEEDLNLAEPGTIEEEPDFSDLPDESILEEAVDDELVTEPDLTRELEWEKPQANPDSMNIPMGMGSSGDEALTAPVEGGEIPVVSDIIDPNNPGTADLGALNDSLSFDLMSKIQTVVEQAISKEVGRITTTLRDNVMDEVKNQLPAVISKVLKSRK